ncbi:GNAT family N-acetyltransferase [Candidatus Heimdallarchaeota archaeon B3_Heim]|nr:MAG: GNAT family N-acetyltransferase [Candidatus Heimdallarchaeota archaeon B3_Heim]
MINFRPATPNDSEYLYNLKKKTLREYIELIWGWDEEVQRNYHRKNFEPKKYQIIQENGEDIGCLSIEEQSKKFFLSIIEITPEYQNKGIGSELIHDLIDKGLQEEKTIELQVLKVNKRAFNLYKSLGFTLKDENQTHYQMTYSTHLSRPTKEID